MSALPDDPIFTQSDPAEFAHRFKALLIKVGCSEEYAEAARVDALARTVQTEDALEGNAILCARAREVQAAR